MTLREDRSPAKETAFFQDAKLFNCSCFSECLSLLSLLEKLFAFLQRLFKKNLSVLSLGKAF